MRRRSRHIESSEIALMAVVTKAMGAFLILMIFGFKYYVEDANGRREADNIAKELASARSSLDAAQELIQRASNRKGDVAQEEYDAALEQLLSVQENLKQALASVAELKARLDQTLSQNGRLREELAKAVEDLKLAQAEVLAAKESLAAVETRLRELELELTRLKQPLLFMQLRMLQAPDAKFRLAFSIADNPLHSLDDIPATATDTNEGVKYSPISKADRTDGDAFTSCELSALDGPAQQQIYIRSAKPIERIAVYVKLLNALPQGGKVYRGTIEMDLRGSFVELPVQLSEAAPFAFVGLVDVIGFSGSKAVVQQTESHVGAWFQHRIDTAANEANLTCEPFADEHRDELKALLIKRLRPVLIQPFIITRAGRTEFSIEERARAEAMLEELATLYGEQKVTLDAIMAKSELLVVKADRVPPADRMPVSDANEGKLRARLQAAMVPEPMIKEFIQRIRDGWFVAADVDDRLRQLKIPQLEGSFIQKAEQYKVVSWYVGELETIVDSGQIVESDALQLLSLFGPAPARLPVGVENSPIVPALSQELERRGFTKKWIDMTLIWCKAGMMDLNKVAELFGLSTDSAETIVKEKP